MLRILDFVELFKSCLRLFSCAMKVGTDMFIEQRCWNSKAYYNLNRPTHPAAACPGQFLSEGGWVECEAAGPDKHSFAWPSVSIISQRESLILKKVVNLLVYICPSWLPHEGPSSWGAGGAALISIQWFNDLCYLYNGLTHAVLPLDTGTSPKRGGGVFSLLNTRLGLLFKNEMTIV